MAEINGGRHQQWPLSCLQPDSDDKFALIILNTSLEPVERLFSILWNKALLRACVDGGLNEVYKVTGAGKLTCHQPLVITGDFDSVSTEVLQFYRDMGCDIVPTPDQDFTDFSKCLRIICERIVKERLQLDSIVVMAPHGGRFDHIMGNINTLFMASSWTNLPVYLITSEGLTTLLGEGKHTLHTDTGLEGKHCGLIPVGQSCPHVTTRGLKWNLDDQTLEFGKLVSTSNSYDSNDGTVIITTESPIVWTMDFCLK